MFLFLALMGANEPHTTAAWLLGETGPQLRWCEPPPANTERRWDGCDTAIYRFSTSQAPFLLGGFTYYNKDDSHAERLVGMSLFVPSVDDVIPLLNAHYGPQDGEEWHSDDIVVRISETPTGLGRVTLSKEGGCNSQISASVP